MEDLEVQPVAPTPEENEMVRHFSLGLGPTVAYPNVVHAVADHTTREREREAARWRPKYQTQGASSGVELAKLGVEASELQKIIEAFPEARRTNNWSLADVQAAVTDARQTWEHKKRWFGGKTQKKYHDVMCNMNAHSGILKMVPESNTYVSLLAGAITTIVKASVSHRRNIGELTRALKEVNDEAQACVTDTHLIQSEDIQVAVAKFYIALFLFYGDVIKWYQSSSSRKAWHSLDEDFADQFTAPLENIKRLSKLVQRAASSGSGAEIRVTRLAVEDLDDDVRAGFQGIVREQREISRMMQIAQAKHTAMIERLQDSKTRESLPDQLWSRAGMSGTALLLGQRENMEADEKRTRQIAASQDQVHLTTVPKGKDLGDEDKRAEALETPTTMFSLSKSVERLLNFIPQGVRTLDLRIPPALAFDQRITIALERWTKSKASTLLYLEAAAFCAEVRLPQVSVAAARIVVAADELKLPTISFFCDVPPDGNHPSSSRDATVEMAAPIVGLVYSLIFQLIDVLPPLTATGPLIDPSLVESLDGAIGSLPEALDLFSRLLKLAPPFLICVIDGLHVFEPSIKYTTHTRDFLSVIKRSLDTEQKVFKFLFTDSKRAFSLLPEIPSENREIVEGVRVSGSGRVGPAAGRAFTNLRFDD